MLHRLSTNRLLIASPSKSRTVARRSEAAFMRGGQERGGVRGGGKERGEGGRGRQSSDALVPPRLFQYPDRDVKGKAPLNVYWGVHGGKGGWHLYRALYLQFAGCSWKSNKRTNDIYTPDHGPHHCASISTSPHSCSASAPPASPM